MKQIKRPLIKCLIFAALVIVLTAFFSWFFYPRNNYTEESTDAISSNALLGERINSVDVLFIGDSQAYESISPMQMWSEEGITSFVSGTGAQPICELTDFIRAGLKKQNFKLVVLESDAIFGDCSLSKYGYTVLKRYVPLLQYHDRWKLIGSSAFTLTENFTRTDDLKGYHYDTAVSPCPWNPEGHMGDINSFEELGKAAKLSIREMKQLCETNDVQFIILSVPTVSWNYGRHNGVQQIADELGIDYIDMNLIPAMDEIDWMGEDAQDEGVHVNCNGARKVTACLENILSENYSLPDHREDPLYESWNECQLKYERLLAGDSSN